MIERLPARRVVRILALLPLALCLLIPFLHAGCTSSDDKPQEHVVIPVDAPDDESWHTTILFTDSVRMKARMTVGHARRYINKMQTLLDSSVYVEFYNSQGEINATLIADSARIDDRTKDMVAYGNVHVNSDHNLRTVDTDQLHWSNDRRVFFSDKRVKIIDRRDDRVIEGVGFESDDGLSNYKIFNASGQFRRPE
jgi:LPS export ABC transporter protein LptC